MKKDHVKTMLHVKAMLREGFAAPVSEGEHIIDCDTDPFEPDGLKAKEHYKGGQFRFDAAQVQLFLAEGQQNGHILEGKKLRKELAGKFVLNANVLDYLLAHTELIPEDWKGKYVFFWGTVYSIFNGDLCVRYLRWRGGRWDCGDRWPGSIWLGNDPAALRVS